MPEPKKMTATKAHGAGVGGAVATLAMMLLAKYGLAETPTQEQLFGAVEIIAATIAGGVIPWLLSYFSPRNAIKLMVPVFAAILLVGCAGYEPGGSMFIDHDRDPATPPIEVTQEQRCAIYNSEMALIEAKPEPLSDFDTGRIATLQRFRLLALCPERPTS